MRSGQDLVDAIEVVVRASEERAQARDAALPEARRLARYLPWVHRTRRHDWLEVFRTELLRASLARTAIEHAFGHPRSIYFFVGSCALPQGLAAFLFTFGESVPEGSTFNPYDTGAVNYRIISPSDPEADWDDAVRLRHVQATLGGGTDLASFLAAYLAAHFRRPLDYVRRSQIEGPDFPPYHGLTGGDRRAWTIEARVPHDLPLTVVPKDGLREIWLQSQGLQRALPSHIAQHTRHPPDDSTLAEAVAQRIEELLTEGHP